jgi:DNA-binding MurR/RpiR family transcriptional regulator
MDDAPAQTQPPATLQVDTQFAGSALGQQLQRLLAKGRGSDAMIADFLLRNPVRATAWGIEELANQVQTSTATLSRFARKLGFEGFAALRAAMAEVLHKAMQPVFQPVEKLRGALQRESGSGGINPVLSESLQANLSNLGGTVAGLDLARLNTVSRRVLAAETVYTLGLVPARTWRRCWRSICSRFADRPSMWWSLVVPAWLPLV